MADNKTYPQIKETFEVLAKDSFQTEDKKTISMVELGNKAEYYKTKKYFVEELFSLVEIGSNIEVTFNVDIEKNKLKVYDFRVIK